MSDATASPSFVFPSDFLWGAATASYQIEGGVAEDGRAPSIWDSFSHTPGKIFGGDTGDVACDHYHRWRDDIAIMRQLGLRSYRFSVAWPRVLPQGTGAVNTVGLDWYDRLVDGLLEAGITPFVTLYHWDLPQALEDRGGWANRETVDAFVTYADVVARRLGDRVLYWVTHNEPWVASMVGYYEGYHAPGLRNLRAALLASHHLLLSHGRAVPALRSSNPRAQVGIVLNLAPSYPAGDTEEDFRAARLHDGYVNRWFLDPLFGRGYPDDIWALYGSKVPGVQANDFTDIAAPLDFLGVNHYGPVYVHSPQPGAPSNLGFVALSPEEYEQRGFETVDRGGPVSPRDFRLLLTSLTNAYKPKSIYVTENGINLLDDVVDGAVHDTRRVNFLTAYIQAMASAMADGAPVRGYFVWSLLDNFEWDWGTSKRYGLVYVDYPTQKRIIKDSGIWYRRLITQGSIA
jgi:beta-glucosidase